MQGFLNNRYLKTKKSKYSIKGNQTARHVVDYLRIGSPGSNISAYLYDKTKEMNEVKHKPWIHEKWQANGINTDETVYRLEISLKEFKIMYEDENGMKKTSIYMEDLANEDYIHSLFFRGLNTAFKFKRNTHIKNKSQMPDLVFFKQAANHGQIIFDCDKMENSRHTKGVINFLEKINNEIRKMREGDRTHFSRTAEALAEVTALQRWYEDKYKSAAGNYVGIEDLEIVTESENQVPDDEGQKLPF